MASIKIIALTHKNFDIAGIGKFHIPEEEWNKRFSSAKSALEIDELLFLSTCNRAEFLLCTLQIIDKTFLEKFFLSIHPEIKKENLERAVSSSAIFENEEALRHLFHVASSLDSMVVGEREIITQVRNAYELCRKLGLAGDTIRLSVQKAIECAKKIYSQTQIAKNPVSVMSLAYRKLRDLNVKLDARFLLVGAGITNLTLAKYLKKHGFTNFVVFNRTLSRGEKLANELNGSAFSLDELKNYSGGFDVLITCTGSAQPIITKDIYSSLISNSLSDKLEEGQTGASKKIIIDLAVPGDISDEVLDFYDIHLISVNNLREIAKKNLQEREKELASCKKIIEEEMEIFKKEFKERTVEIAMSAVPRKVKEIRERAVKEIFVQEIAQMDRDSKETLDKIISYLEKKYISVPMKMAKEIMMNSPS